MEVETVREDTGSREINTIQGDPPNNGSGDQAPAEGTTQGDAEVGTTTTGVTPPTALTHLRFGTPAPPTNPIRARGGTALDNNYIAEHQKRYAPL